MNPDALIDSLSGHLGALESTTNVLILIAGTGLVAALGRRPTFGVLGLELQRRHAFAVLSVILLFGFAVLVIYYLRIADLLRLLPASHERAGATVVTTYPWALNPFSYFGAGTWARLYVVDAVGLYVATWWGALACLSLQPLPNPCRVLRLASASILVIFGLLFLALLFAISRSFVELVTIADRLPDGSGFNCVEDVFRAKMVMSFAGMAAGILLFVVLRRLSAIGWPDVTTSA